jgi:LmbE family N-acetylglucosaminyl deacetylase
LVTALGHAAWVKLRDASEELTVAELTKMSPIVVLAPHQDDETLGCGGLLSAASEAGLKPRVIYLSDGGASHRNSPTWTSGDLATVRRKEALAALRVLGVPEDQVEFLDWPDAAPLDPDSAEYRACIDGIVAIFTTIGAKSLWAPRAGESHCDHQAATELADQIARKVLGLRRLDYMVWGWDDDDIAKQRPSEQVWSLPCASHAGRRRRALACHKTQTTQLIADAQEAFIIPEALAALTERPFEIFLERL